MQGSSTMANPDGFYFRPLTFDAMYIFSIRATIRVTPQQTTRQTGGQEGVCTIIFIGYDSEIVLVSNAIRLVTYWCRCTFYCHSLKPGSPVSISHHGSISLCLRLPCRGERYQVEGTAPARTQEGKHWDTIIYYINSGKLSV